MPAYIGLPTLKNRRSFTLIEMLITVSILSVIGLAVFSTFNSSIKVWQRLNRQAPALDIGLAFEKLSGDLRNSFPFQNIKFAGSKDKLIFAAIVRIGDKTGIHDEIGSVEYALDNKQGKLSRAQLTYSQLYQEKQPASRVLLSNIKGANFKYYYFDPEKQKYAWSDSIDSIPLAVQISIDMGSGVFSNTWSKIITIPMAETYDFALKEVKGS